MNLYTTKGYYSNAGSKIGALTPIGKMCYNSRMTEVDKKKLAAIMEKHGVIVGYLFGSAARGKMGPHSDIDVAVLFDESLNRETQDKAKEYIRRGIESSSGKEKVDVIILNQETNPVLLHGAVLHGQVILVKNTSLQARLSRRVLHEYEDTRYLRETSYRILRRKIKEGTFGLPYHYVTN